MYFTNNFSWGQNGNENFKQLFLNNMLNLDTSNFFFHIHSTETRRLRKKLEFFA
jgi:hypothetical protein